MGAWTITTLAYWVALPLFFVIARFGSTICVLVTQNTYRNSDTAPEAVAPSFRVAIHIWRSRGVRLELVATAGTGVLRRRTGMFFLQPIRSSKQIGIIMTTCYFDEAGRTINFRQVEHYDACLLGIEDLLGRSLAGLA